MVKIKDVAELAGVSVASVSRYLNTPDMLSEPVRKKIEAAVRELDYVPSPIARSLRTNTTKTIALIIPTLSNLYYVDLYHVIHQHALEKGYTINLITTDYSKDAMARHLAHLISSKVDGIIISFLDEDNVLEEIKNAQEYVPVALLTACPSRSGFNCVFIDSLDGAKKSTQHLIDLGRKSLAFAGGPKNWPTLEKIRGFEAALRQNNIANNKNYYFGDKHHYQTGYYAVRHFLTQEIIPDGIVCATDDIAAGCIKYLIQNGFSIPEHVAVIGFNGIFIADAFEPSISSMQHPMEQIAQEVFNLLLEQIARPSKRRKQVTLYTTLIVNKSTDSNAPQRFLL